ncbi:MAG TPA: DUF1801 domain-containing protein [Aestuariivirga sp.]|nr:DUF1801 domain-containing protein [Aestuariivirga sp.]
MAGKAKFTTIDGYIAQFPKEVQAILEKIRQTVADAAPGAVEAISYQIPTFKLNGSNLVHFAAWKDHIGFYATPAGKDAKKMVDYILSVNCASVQKRARVGARI